MPLGLAQVFAGFLVCALLLRAFSYNVVGLDWDESLYIVMAQRWLTGDLPYVGIWDQHPPGLPALFALGQWLVGDGLLAARVGALLAVSSTAALLFAMLDRFARQRLAGCLAGILYLLVMTRPDGLAANTEVFNNLLVTAAAYLLLPEPTLEAAISVRRMVSAALLLGLALQIKYVVFPEAVLLCSTVLLRAWWLGVRSGRIVALALLAMAAGVLPTVAMTLYFWLAGALEPFLDANLRANVAYVGLPISFATAVWRLRLGLLPITTFALWPFLLALLMRSHISDRRLRWIGFWLAIWLIAAAIDVVLPLKFWKHYFNALLPPLSLAAGLGCVLVARAFARRSVWATCAAFTITAAPIVGLLVKHAPDSRAIGGLNVPQAIVERIALAGDDGRDVYVFNYDPIVYAYAHATPPTRYVLGIELADFSVSSGASAVREVDRVLTSAPKWIVIADPSLYKFADAIWCRLDRTLLDYRLDSYWSESDYIQPPIQVRLYQRVPAPIQNGLDASRDPTRGPPPCVTGAEPRAMAITLAGRGTG